MNDYAAREAELDRPQNWNRRKFERQVGIELGHLPSKQIDILSKEQLEDLGRTLQQREFKFSTTGSASQLMIRVLQSHCEAVCGRVGNRLQLCHGVVFE